MSVPGCKVIRLIRICVYACDIVVQKHLEFAVIISSL